MKNEKNNINTRINFIFVAISVAVVTIAFILYFTNYNKRQEKNKNKKFVKIMKQNQTGIFSLNFNVMGTFARVKFFGTKEQTQLASQAVTEQFNLINEHLSAFNKESELSQLNETAFDKPFKCSPMLWDVLVLSKKAYKFSNGAFDITAKPLMDLWGFYRKRTIPTLPTKEETTEALSKVGLNKVIFNDKNKSVKFTVKGMAIDLGGIAKGYAVDLAVQTLLEKKIIDNGLINLGGNIRILPQTMRDLNNNKPIKIGITDPFDNDKICGEVSVNATSIATSGDYERFVIINNKHYGHIMNPKTGKPAEHIYGVSIITPLAADADWMSTTIFINGDKDAIKILEKFPDTAILIIKESKDGKIIIKKHSNLDNKYIWKNIKIKPKE